MWGECGAETKSSLNFKKISLGFANPSSRKIISQNRVRIAAYRNRPLTSERFFLERKWTVRVYSSYNIFMEKIKNTAEGNENDSEKLSGREKFEIILGLFGTDTAREAFIETCKQYVSSRRDSVLRPDAENYQAGHRPAYSPPRRANLHNSIMETLTSIATQSKSLSPLQTKVLREMYDRNITAEIVKEYIASISNNDEGDEDEKQKKRSGQSDTAYYHSLGKGT